MKKYTKYRAGVSLFFSVLLVVGVLNVVCPKPTYSEAEHRDLAKMPKFSWATLANGEYISKFQLYFSDTFFGREPLSKIGTWFRSLYSLGSSDEIFVPTDPTDSGDHGIAGNDSSDAPSSGVNSDATSSGSSSQAPSSAAPSSQAPSSAAPPEREEDASYTNGMYVSQSTVFQLYNYSPKVNERYAAAVSDFAARYPNVKTYCMVVPINTAFYLPEKLMSKTSDERASIQKIYDAMSDAVTTIDAYTPLEQHANEYIYFRTDHHWTQLGAYYGYTAFAKATGVTPFSLDGLRTIRYDGFLGSLYSTLKTGKTAVNLASLEKNPDYVEAYIPDFQYKLDYYPKESITKPGYILGKGTLVNENMKKGSYMCFIHGDQPMEIIENQDNRNGKTLMIFKESYGNAFVPLVCHDYEKVIVIDPRYFKCSLKELMGMHNVTEALFLNYILAPGTPQRVNEIEKVVRN